MEARVKVDNTCLTQQRERGRVVWRESLMKYSIKYATFIYSKNSKQFQLKPTGAILFEKRYTKSHNSQIAVPAVYVLSILTFFVVCMVCVLYPAHATNYVPYGKVPVGAMCLRASRYADYATVRLMAGTPIREIEAMIRLDRVVDDGSASTYLWSSMMVRSDSLNCTTDGTSCSDSVLVSTSGVYNKLVSVKTRFELFADYADYTTITGYRLGLKGSVSLVRGYDYYLTTTHLCWIPHDDDEPSSTMGTNAIVGDVTSEGELVVNEGALFKECNNTSVKMFPHLASSELLWLALTDRYLYEHGEKYLEQRRVLVETGISCASSNTSLNHFVYLYQMQCVQTGFCQTSPSAPYRRVASSHTVEIRLPRHTTDAIITFTKAKPMEKLPSVLSSSDATWLAAGQLGILMLVAAVSFLRASQTEVSPASIVIEAHRSCFPSKDTVDGSHTFHYCSEEVYSNAFIGALAIGTRLVVIVLISDALLEDNNGPIVVSELTGCLVSTLHGILRYSFLDSSRESPLTRLGGPMSNVDVCSAIIIALSETPLLGTRQTFASVGRMLAALLTLVTNVPTLIYSPVACVMKGTCFDDNKGKDRRLTLYVSAVLWLVQSSCTAITLTSVFVNPFLYTLTRSIPNDTTLLRISVLLGVLTTSLPMINKVVLSYVQVIKKENEHNMKDDDGHNMKGK